MLSRRINLTPVAAIVVVLSLFGIAMPTTAQTPSPTTVPATEPRFFSQTGFRIDTDAFWTFFQQRGGVRTFGYPVSRTFTLDGFQVQIFQREVMQLQSDGGVQTLNLLDQGLLPYTNINGSIFPAPDPAVEAATPAVSGPNYSADIQAFIRSTAPDTFGGQPVNFGTTFSNTVTAQDAPTADPSLLPGFDLQIWGAPTSKPAYDPANHQFTYQRFQRGIMMHDQTCGCTQGLLLADYFKSILTGWNLPPDLQEQAQTSRYYLQYSPIQTQSVNRPALLPASDLTNAFVTEQPGGPAIASSFAYGMNVHLWNFNAQGKGLATGLVKQAGFGWISQQVQWSAVESSPGQFDWSEVDAIVAAAKQSGLNILFSVVHAPAFYQRPGGGLIPADPTTYRTFMQAMASRYAGKVQAYEIWNEENLAREMGVGNVAPASYLPLLEAGSTGVRTGDPAALVLLGAPSPTGANDAGQSVNDLTYLQQLYALNNGEVKPFYDALSAHPSGFSNPPTCAPAAPRCGLTAGFNNDDSFFAFTRVGEYRALMMQEGEGAKKIWFTEFGYCSNPKPPAGYEYCASLTEQNQANFLVQAFTMARGLPYVAAMMQWNLNLQQVVPQTNEQWGFGIIHSDMSARPAYSALLQMPKP